MYERNAIVIDRYFSSVFGYDKKSNLKNNANNYFELVDILEKYQMASEIEDNVMDEFEKIANKIKEIQRKQDSLEKKALKYYENRKNLFQSLDEDEETLKEKFKRNEEEIKKNENEIEENSDDFVIGIKEFNEKSEIRSKCGRERRIIESDYQKILNVTLENFNNILKEKLKEIKSFLKTENKENVKFEMVENIMKNGSKEKVPFDINVINTAIDTSLYIEEKRAEILLTIYDKTSKLFDEIKNDTVKIEKHKKQVGDSKSKLDFLGVITEYIILFLDNERMNTIGGEEEHRKVMNEACNNLQNDLVEIQNMYSLLIKEINGKATKKLYKQLYNIEYLNELKEQEVKFEKDISKLNMSGTLIYPDYWRLEGMKKIFDTFKTIMTDVYEVDLSEYEPMDITFEVNKKMLNNEIETFEDKLVEKTEKQDIKFDKINKKQDSTQENEDITKEIKLKFDTNQEDDEEDDEEFHWDVDNEENEVLFANSNIVEDDEDDEEDDEENEVIEIQNEEDERDKEIDELLGIFDSEDTDFEEESYDDEDNHILQIEDDEELDDGIFKKDDEEEKKEKPKRKKLFGRRK